MKQITFSVIIPAYNSDAYLDECLQSVMLQKNISFEVVLVNDGSTDQTAKICKKWTNLYCNIQYIEQEHGGQGTARNTAVKHAHGEWLVFLDSDDVLLPDALRHLNESVESGYDVICYGSEFISQNQEKSSIYLPVCTDVKREIMQETLSVLWDKMIRKELWEQEKIELTNNYGEDIYPVYMLFAKARKIRTLPLPLIRHYDRENNLSSKPDRIIQIVQSISDTLDAFIEKNMFQEYEHILFLMLEKQHRHYRELWRINHLIEEKEIIDKLEIIAQKYFSEKYQKCLNIEEEALVLIGKFYRLPDIFRNWNIYFYDSMEHYLLDENKMKDKVCHFIVNVENEIQSVSRQTRTVKWALSNWRLQCLELMESRELGNLKGTIVLYCSEEKRTELINCFENIAQAVWNSVRLEYLVEFCWRRNESNNKNIIEQDIEYEIFEKSMEMMSINYRWEYLRLNYNVNLLCPWLSLKQQGINLKEYFLRHGYKCVGIYGNGYLGKLLIMELKNSPINISFLIDQDKNQELEYRLYSLEDELPFADVIVVSVVHIYSQIKDQLGYKCDYKVVSLEEIVGWCREIYQEEGY